MINIGGATLLYYFTDIEYLAVENYTLYMMKSGIPIYLILVLIIAGCSKEEAIVNSPSLFTSLESSKTGVHFSNEIKDDETRNILLYANFYGGAGVGVGDFNKDGLEDLYFAGNIVSDRLYLNKGNLEFEDVTKTAGLVNDGGWSTGVTVADINNDGSLDIYITRELYDDKPEWRANLLYINRGDGTFEESAEKYGVADEQRTRHATFFDYNKDGFLDLFLLTQPPNPGTYSEYKGTTLLKPEYHIKLMKNTGNGFFVDVS
uniref:FG-GAP repeat domain-containing protein n=1 Tax=Pricia sp. TaxID=2268138 RepID=UPI003592F1A1